MQASDIARALLDGEAEAVVGCDRDGIVRFWNAGAARLFGFAADEAVGRSLDLIIPDRLRARHWDGWQHTMDTGTSRYSGGDTLSVPALRKDGTQISVDFTISPLRDTAGRITGVAAVMRDVTARFDELKALRKQARTSSS
ncbi:MAG TPA: PAS domain-containing protein [Pseudolabrys sp.]|nr:PAS domain-containing protein [Pseudolabrys sp.]